MRKASTRVQTLVGAIGSMLIHGLNKKVLDVSLQRKLGQRIKAIIHLIDEQHTESRTRILLVPQPQMFSQWLFGIAYVLMYVFLQLIIQLFLE